MLIAYYFTKPILQSLPYWNTVQLLRSVYSLYQIFKGKFMDPTKAKNTHLFLGKKSSRL